MSNTSSPASAARRVERDGLSTSSRRSPPRRGSRIWLAARRVERDGLSLDQGFPRHRGDRRRGAGLTYGSRRGGLSAMVYLWIKAFHVIAVIAWMAGML